jgi:hypothetical protein
MVGQITEKGVAYLMMIDDYLAPLASDERAIFAAIAEYAFRLGYKAKKDKTNTLGYTFTHSKVKKPILRFTSNRSIPIIRLKFFASPTYSHFFHEAIRRTIEEYHFPLYGLLWVWEMRWHARLSLPVSRRSGILSLRVRIN